MHQYRSLTVWLSHDPTAVDRNVLDGVIAVCDEILAGTNDWPPYEFMGQSLRMAKKVKDRVRLDGGLGNIVYHPEKVFAAKKCIHFSEISASNKKKEKKQSFGESLPYSGSIKLGRVLAK